MLLPRAKAGPAKGRRGKEEDKDEEEGKAGEREQKSAGFQDGKCVTGSPKGYVCGRN